MYFYELENRLLEAVRQSVHSGRVTERKLARKSGLSQPHVHNILKGIRSLTSRSADRLLRGLGMTVPDLLWKPMEQGGVEIRAVPVVRNPVGPGVEASFAVHSGHMPLPASMVDGLTDPVLARLAPDLALPVSLAADDLVLLDQDPQLREAPGGDGFWVIAEGSGLQVRYLRMEEGRLFSATEVSRGQPGSWQAVSGQSERQLGDIVRARLVWFGRAMAQWSQDPDEELTEPFPDISRN